MNVVACFMASRIFARSGEAACDAALNAAINTSAGTAAPPPTLRAGLNIGHRAEQAAFPTAGIVDDGGRAIEDHGRAPLQIVDRPGRNTRVIRTPGAREGEHGIAHLIGDRLGVSAFPGHLWYERHVV